MSRRRWSSQLSSEANKGNGPFGNTLTGEMFTGSEWCEWGIAAGPAQGKLEWWVSIRTIPGQESGRCTVLS